MISEAEIDFYAKIENQLSVVFDVGCRDDNPFKCEVHQFDPIDQPDAKGIFNHTAVGDKLGNVQFFPEYSSIIRRELTGEKWANITHYCIEVPVITIDYYCEKHNIQKIDLLKIDTEGYDLHVIQGALKTLPKIKYIQFEHWDDEKTESIKKLLKDFKIEILGGKPMNYIAKNMYLTDYALH